MKIYFACTVVGDRSSIESGREIVKILEGNGHIVLTKHLFEDNAYTADSKITEKQVYDRDMVWLEEADVVLSDVTGSSFGVGFEIGFVLGSMNKKVFLIYDANKKSKISRMALGLHHKNCTVFAYNNFDELKKFVEENF
jgi:2'-deoxynucleoside 5'-phosphate N-hydrolase